MRPACSAVLTRARIGPWPALAALSDSGVRLLVNLHERPHDLHQLERHGLREAHLPVKDFAAPSPEQMELGVRMIFEALAEGEAVAVRAWAGRKAR